MFMQIIQGKIADADLMNRQVAQWRTDVKPGATGYLGSTSGITDDGQFIVMVRFDSEASATANSERAEQGAWWEQTVKAFDGEPSFTNCTEVDTMMGGGSNEAGFVQIMHGRAKDPVVMRTIGRQMEEQLGASRPDILGGIVGWHGDRYFTQAIYFTSEEAAREGEKQMTDDGGAEEWMAMMDGDLSFTDLRSPDLD